VLLFLFSVAVVASCKPSSLPPAATAIPRPQATLTSEQHVEQAIALYESAQYEPALQELSKAIDLNQDFARAYYERSKVYSFLGEWAKVSADCSRTLDLDPKYSEAYYVQSIAYIQQKQYQKAVNSYNMAMGYEPAKKELKEIQKIASLVVPAGEVLLLDVECSVSSGKDCRGNFVPYNNTLKLHVFINPGKSDIEINTINFFPNIGTRSQVNSPVKYFNIVGIEYLVTCISSDTPPAVISGCSIDYRVRNSLLSKKSNIISSVEINEDSNPLICP
jgi:tetratricopeptide (TPR) repeat protein